MILISICLALGSNVFAQDQSGFLFMRNYTPEDMGAGAQNWAMTQAENGLIYVGNNDGVLEFDGAEWRRVRLTNSSICRSLSYSRKDKKIYVGGQGEFGFIKTEANGALRYESLSDLLTPEQKHFADVWRCYSNDDGTYFFTRKVIFYWDGKKITPIPIHYHSPLNMVNGKIYHIEKGVGLTVFDKATFKPLKGAKDVLNEDLDVYAILPISGNRLLLATHEAGLYTYNPKAEKNAVSKLNSSVEKDLIKHKIYHGTVAANGDFVFCSVENGVYIVNKFGELVQHIGKKEGLINETVFGVFMDKENALWAMTDYGLSRIEVYSPFRMWNEQNGLDGAVYAIQKYQDWLYIGTGKGVFRIQNNRKEPIDGLNTQVWGLTLFQNAKEKILLAPTTHGVFEIKGNSAKNIGGEESISRLYQSKINPNRLFVVPKIGLQCYFRANQEWIYESEVTSVRESIADMGEDRDGELWLVTAFKGRVIRIKLDTADVAAPAIPEIYDAKSGLPSTEQLELFEYDGRIIFCSHGQFYEFNKTKNKFEVSSFYTASQKKVLNSKTFEINAAIAPDANNLFVFAELPNRRFLITANKTEKGEFETDSVTFRRLPNMTVTDASMLKDGQFLWIGSTEGLFRYDLTMSKRRNNTFFALVRSVKLSRNDSIVSWGGNTAKTALMEFAYSNNSLMFKFSSSSFDEPNANQFSVLLKGYDKGWSDWNRLNQKEYTNLSEGEYTFRVRCRNIYGIVSEEASYTFVVLPPWYRTIWAYLGYLVILGLIIWGLLSANTERIQRKNIKLEYIVAERTAELNKQKEDILAFNAQLSEQKESITKQADELRKLNEAIIEQSTQIQKQKEEVERTYENVKVLAGMGRRITATLRFEDLSMVVYSSVTALMDAATFGIGIYDEKNHRLEFSGTVEDGEVLPSFYDYLDSENRLSTLCFTRSKEIIIHDIYRDYNKYIEGVPLPKVGRLPQSVIYVPLEVKDRVIGVCTVQSFKKDAYSRYELDFLRNLAAYISIAVANAKSYDIINAKNTQITDSLRYAQTIQQVILPSDLLKKASFQDFFAIYRPRDIVSGDFYWLTKANNRVVMAVVDCTGHGVPGAFMSLIGNNLLDKIIKVQGITEPARILNLMNEELNEFIAHKSSSEDGMDVSLCTFDFLEDEHVLMRYAGAKRPAYIYHTETQVLEHVKGQHRSIGVRKKVAFEFNQSDHHLKRGDIVYLFTDGFVDQHNPQKIRLGTQKFAELLTLNASLPLSQQEYNLDKYLKEFEKGMEQRDDITLVGMKV